MHCMPTLQAGLDDVEGVQRHYCHAPGNTSGKAVLPAQRMGTEQRGNVKNTATSQRGIDA